MAERLVTQWVRRWVAALVSMFQPGPVDTRQIGTSMHQSRAIQRGVTKLFSACIVTISKHTRGTPIRSIAAQVERCAYNPRWTPIHSPLLCSKALNLQGCDVFRIRMAG